MTKELIFKKEFEDFILKQNAEEALKSLVPNTNEYIYLQFCEEFKQCIISQKISPKLNSILKKAKDHSKDLSRALNTRKNLLEYDLPSTKEKRKNEIINFLYRNYCNFSYNYNPPYFVREKNEQKNEMDIESDEIENRAIIELTEDIIKEKVEKIASEITFLEDIKNRTLNGRIELFVKFLKDDKSKINSYFLNSDCIPFYLMKKDEFTLFINFLKKCEFDLFNICDKTLILKLY